MLDSVVSDFKLKNTTYFVRDTSFVVQNNVGMPQ